MDKTTLYRAYKYIIRGIPINHINAQISYCNPRVLLKGKKIIITGGSRGIGLAMAKRFKAEGAEILISGRNEKTLISVSSKIGCKYLVFDISNVESCYDFITKADMLLDGANILVNNAGISLHERTFFDVTPNGFNRQLQTNLVGPFFLTQSFLKITQDRNYSRNVLFVSSETGDTVDFRPYGYTKGAINSMVRGLAYLFKQDNVRINAVSPGITATDMTKVNTDETMDAGNYGAGRYYLPEEVAEIALFLISDLSNCVSGQIVTCNNANTVNARWH